MKVNDEIQAQKVTVISEEGNNLGDMSLEEAKSKARLYNLDLVEVNNIDGKSVCKIIDYGKFKYNQNKKEKKNKQQSKKPPLKEIRLGINTAEHDKQFKLKHAKEFIRKGHDVKFTIRLKGREAEFSKNTKSVLEDIKDEFENISNIKQDVSVEGRSHYIVLSPQQ